MAISRYEYSNSVQDGKGISKPYNIHLINRYVDEGRIPYNTYIIKSSERLDQLAGAVYGDSSYWWVIAAASKIGWGMQLPQGTVLKIPKNLSDVIEILT